VAVPRPIDGPTTKEPVMSNPLFGTKHVCEACAERFYDLNRSPAICFKCGATQPPPKPRMSRPMRAPSDRGAFSRRPLPVLAEEKQEEPVDDLVVEEVETADDEDADFDEEDIEVEIEVDPEDGKVVA
jgi:uncharacterized protein (TIGR02300 family)